MLMADVLCPTSSNASVASPEADAWRRTSSPPGWSSRNLVTSYTLPWMATQQSFLEAWSKTSNGEKRFSASFHPFPPKDFGRRGRASVLCLVLQPQQMRLWLVAGPGESVDCTYGSLFFFILFKLTKATVTLSSAASRLCRYATHCYHIIFSPSSVQTFCFADETHGNGDGPVLNRKRQSICMTTTHQIERTYQSITQI